MNQVKADINTYLDRLKKGINITKQKLAQDTLIDVVGFSPVWSGTYVESHKVGLDNIILEHEKPYYGPPFPDKLNEGHALALKVGVVNDLSPVIDKAEFRNTIFISNSIPYANQVEFGGGLTPAYHPYGRAALKLKAKMFLMAKTNALPNRK